MKYYWNEIPQDGPTQNNDDGQPNMKTKGNSFIILAAINFFLLVLCYWCGKASMDADNNDEEEELERKEEERLRKLDAHQPLPSQGSELQ